jgi:hypothetical protein
MEDYAETITAERVKRVMQIRLDGMNRILLKAQVEIFDFYSLVNQCF